MRFVSFSFLAFFLIISFNSKAQGDIGSWNIVSLKVNTPKKWSFFAEAQIRSLRFYNWFHYYEYKAGATYKLDKNFSLTTGIGNYDTYSSGGNFKDPILNDEIRTWVQINMNQYFDKIKIDHRYRAEQRFTLSGYKNRFRYRINTIIPLNKKKIEAKTMYLNAFNEIFFTNQAPYFERNRLFGGLGYVANNSITFQMGYLYQFDYKINDETGRNFFQVSLLFDLDIKKNKKETIQGSVD